MKRHRRGYGMSFETAGKSGTEHSGVGDRDVKKYLNNVRKLLHCPRAQRREFLRQLEANIYSYISENEVENMEGVIREFGSPEDIAQSFLEECSIKAFSQSMGVKRKAYYAIVAIVFIAAVSVVVIQLIDFERNESYRNGYWVDTIGYGSPPPEPTNTFIAGIH